MDARASIIDRKMEQAKRAWRDFVRPSLRSWRGGWGKSSSEFGFDLPDAFTRLTEEEFERIRHSAEQAVMREFKRVFMQRRREEAERLADRVLALAQRLEEHRLG